MNRDPREDFKSLKEDLSPPSSLEERTVAALRERGLLRARARPSWSRTTRFVVSAAASLGLLALGFGAGRFTTSPALPAGETSTFALLLRSGDTPKLVTPREEERLVREYSDWAAAQDARGRLLGGEKLEDERRTLRRQDEALEIVPASTRGEPDAIQGYFLIRAAGYDEAVDIAADCPHLRYGGEIEVREIASR